MMCFRQPHWNIFSQLDFIEQNAVGRAPADWVRIHHIDIPEFPHPLPDHPLDRAELLEICNNHNNPDLFCYICIMAWGNQRAANIQKAWEGIQINHANLHALRGHDQILNRVQAFDLFNNQNPVNGLGPAFFTKLFYFMHPDHTGFYIMDTWTARGINLLTGHEVVRMNNSFSVVSENTGINYDYFCRTIDQIARTMHLTGEQLERMLFGSPGNPIGAWNTYVQDNYNRDIIDRPFDHVAFQNEFPDI